MGRLVEVPIVHRVQEPKIVRQLLGARLTVKAVGKIKLLQQRRVIKFGVVELKKNTNGHQLLPIKSTKLKKMHKMVEKHVHIMLVIPRIELQHIVHL
jgi:hypothetical protein